jgi:predicted ATPase
MLKQAACIGNQFDLATMTIIAQISEEVVGSSLQAALREGAISVLNNKYTFTHDRVQQAAF